MSEAPINLINEFLAQQKREEEERAFNKDRERFSKREFNRSQIDRPMRAKEVISLAKAAGLTVEGGKGRHGSHIVAPDGTEWPLPVHGGGQTLANGTQKSILAFIYQNTGRQSLAG